MQFRPELNPQSGVPLYRQLSDYIAGLIHTGRLAGGERLPATRELAGQLGLNRTTVSAAYEWLETEGLLSGQVGRGSFVTQAQNSPASGLNWAALLERHSFELIPPPPPQGAGKEIINFSNSRPADALFPLADFRQSCREVLESSELSQILQLGSPKGYEPLRLDLLEAARRDRVARDSDDVLVTSGCQQGLDLVARIFIRPGDKVVVEDPVYPGLKNAMLQAGAQLTGIPVRADGLDIDALERALLRERPRMLLVTPNFQNPTGATLPHAPRQKIVRLAQACGTVLVENDIYGDLRYEGEAQPCIKSLDSSGDTILLRSFSKVAFPGLRVGWITAPKPVIARIAEAKQLADLHTDQFSQAALLRFMRSGRLARHRTRTLEAGAERLRAVTQACQRYLPEGTRFRRPEGGMNLWVVLPDPLDAGELLPRAQREGVAYLPSRYFGVSRQEPGALRLSFAGLAPAQIRAGVERLGKIFAGELHRVQGQASAEPAPALV